MGTLRRLKHVVYFVAGVIIRPGKANYVKVGCMISFIMGTDTGVGKTFVTALLARAFRDKGNNVLVQKWVSTGSATMSEDLLFIKKIAGLEQDIQPGSPASPYCLEFPSSPHLAAEMEGVRLDKAKIVNSTAELSGRSDVLLIEGVGGGLVPMTRELLLMDLVAELNLPVILVARSSLGTLNHTLLTLEALKTRRIRTLGVVFNSLFQEDERIVQDNMKTIAHFGRVRVYGPVPKVKIPGEALYAVQELVDDIYPREMEP